MIDGLLGRTGTPGAVTVVSSASSGRLPGDLRAGAAAAVDGDPTTSWSPGLGVQPGTWVQYQLSGPLTFDHLDLQVVADGKHSVPTSITVTTPAGSRTVPLPPIPAGTGRPQGSVTIGAGPLPGPHRLRGEDHRGLGPAPQVPRLPVQPGQHRPGGPGRDRTARPVPGDHPGRDPRPVLLRPAWPWTGTRWTSRSPVRRPTALANGGLTIRGCGDRRPGHRPRSGDPHPHHQHLRGYRTRCRRRAAGFVGRGFRRAAHRRRSPAGPTVPPLAPGPGVAPGPDHHDRPGPRGRNPVLDGARPEPERRVEGHHLHRPRPVVLDAHRRVCQRLVRAGRRGPGPDHHHA